MIAKLLLIVLLMAAPAAAELQADQLLLIVNGNVQASVDLADHYASARNVPIAHRVTLDVPDVERLPYADYETTVADPVRQWLAANDPEGNIRCLVTFYGVPLKIDDRKAGEEEAAEARAIEADLNRLTEQFGRTARYLEALAREYEPAFSAVPGDDLEPLILRLQRVSAELGRIARGRSAEVQEQVREELAKVQRTLQSPLEPASTRPALSQAEVQALAQKLEDPAARQQIRAIARSHTGVVEYARLLQAQAGVLATRQTGAATDSELAFVLWGPYLKARFQPNPLWHGAAKARMPRTLMTARLDGRTATEARRLIDDSIAAEAQGLSGSVVIDSRGLGEHEPGGYGRYDQSLRRLAELVKNHTALDLIHDDLPDLIPPGTATEAALYCGWYSVGRYHRPATFKPGAVAFHIASFELTTLRDPANNGWVRGLLADGVAASMGPVNEPYLVAFPPADEFMALLLTGQVSLAEAYWATIPLASWQMCLIGDPLYRPYAREPALKVEALPTQVRGVVSR